MCHLCLVSYEPVYTSLCPVAVASESCLLHSVTAQPWCCLPADTMRGPPVCFPVTRQEGYISKKIMSNSALFRTIGQGYLEHEDAVLLLSTVQRVVYRPPIKVVSRCAGQGCL